MITNTTINNYIILIIIIVITTIFIKIVIIIILFKKKEKKILAHCPKVTLVGTGFEPGTFEFPTYLSHALNDLSYSD